MPPVCSGRTIHRWCQGGDTATAEQGELIAEVHYAVKDLMDLIKTYQSKNKLTKVLMSTSFKRRQENLEAAIDRALDRLQVSGVRHTVVELPAHLDGTDASMNLSLGGKTTSVTFR